MIKKGVISSVQGSCASAYLPDEDNAVTPLIPIAKGVPEVKVGDHCAIAFFEADAVNLADGVIIATY